MIDTSHQEDKQRKAASFLFPIKMTAKLERIQSIAQKHGTNTEPPIGARMKNETTTTDPPP